MRRVLSGLTGLLACLILPVTLVSTWSAAVVTDNERYVETVGPLASEPAVQEAAERRITTRVMAQVQGTPVGARFGDTLETVVRSAVRRVLESEEFATIWTEANRETHRQVVQVLEEDRPATGGMTISLGALVDAVLTRLRVPVAATPPVDVSITVLDAEELERAAEAYRIVDRLGRVLPVVWVLLVLLTLLLAPRRLRALTWLGIGSLVASLLLLVALWLAQGQVVAAAPQADRDLIEEVWRALTADLRTTAWTAAGVSGAIALVAALADAVTRRVGRRDAAAY